MIDEMTRNSLRVSSDGIAGPYLMVTVTQLDAVLAVLDSNHVSLPVRAVRSASSIWPPSGTCPLGIWSRALRNM